MSAVGVLVEGEPAWTDSSVPQLPPVRNEGPESRKLRGFTRLTFAQRVWPRIPTLSSAARCPPGHLQVWLPPITVPRFGPQKVLTS